MKFIVLLSFVVSSFSTSATVLPTPTTRLDSIPAGPRYGVRMGSPNSRPALRPSPRFHTLIVQNPGQPGGNETLKIEILLPPGINEKTIAIVVGHTALKSNEDYQYNAATNRIQILNQEVLRSNEPIEISYDTMRFSYRF
ncbi:hypothetical protein ACFPMF_01290 [Larkinella bovis]|uniref:Uncharacterized protein n=1 Tax=Larkinella bovis TaxID=683041 RepID=A0ABW0I3P0_9BACT